MPRHYVITPLAKEFELLTGALHDQGFTSRVEQVQGIDTLFFPDLNIQCAIGGHGKVQFALTTQFLVMSQQNITRVHCVGAAGSLTNPTKVGDLVIGSTSIEHDYTYRFIDKAPPEFAADPTLLKELHDQSKNRDFDFAVHSGRIASGDEDVIDPARAQELHELTNSTAVAWEGAGGAKACQMHQIPYVEIRGITDEADKNAAGDFRVNLMTAMKNMADFIAQLYRRDEQGDKPS